MLFILDKKVDDSHSFMNGMIEQNLDKNSDIILLYKSGSKNNSKPKYKKSFGFSRNGVGFIFHSLCCVFYFFLENKKHKVVFIRNEPLSLLFFTLLKKVIKIKVYYQSSFPHEKYSGNVISRNIYKISYKLALSKVDKIFTVTKLAGYRLIKYDKNVMDRVFDIPLCSDFSIVNPKRIERKYAIKKPIKYIYIGTFSKLRELDVVIKSFYKAQVSGLSFELNFVGGSYEDFLYHYPEVKFEVEKLVEKDFLNFPGSLERNEVQKMLGDHHIGLNLIPNNDIYNESSSTKLGEYFSQGLLALSSTGIHYHEEIHSAGDIGWLCDFNQNELQKTICKIDKIPNDILVEMSLSATKVCLEHLQYSMYTDLIFDS